MVAPGAPQVETNAITGWPRSFVDDLGVEVTLLAPPQRIVSLAPGFTETLFRIGAGDRLVGRSDFCDEPPEALKVQSVGGLVTPSIEKIVGLAPDLVLVIRGTPVDVIDSLRRAGLPVIARDTRSLSEAIEAIRDIGRYVGMEAQAESLADELEARRRAVEERTRQVFTSHKRPRVLLVASVNPVYAAGAGSIAGDMITIAGGNNVAAGPEFSEAGPWPQLGLEVVVDADPDIIIMASDPHEAGQPAAAAELAAMPGWRDTTAVRRNHLHQIDPDLVSRSGPRLLDGLEHLAAIIHGWAEESGGGG